MNLHLDEALIKKLQLCPCCSSPRLRTLTTPKTWIDADHFEAVKTHLGLTECLKCSLVFVNPRPSDQLLTDFYNKPGYDCHELLFELAQAENDANARFPILERYSSKDCLVDFGSGAGHLLRAAKNRGWKRVAGIEIGQHARLNLQREGFEMYRDLDAAKALRGQVDAVTMMSVLEHLIEPTQVLDGIKNLLRPDGVFFVEVPNADSLRARISESFAKPLFTSNAQRYRAYPIHLYYFNLSSLTVLLEGHGFRVEETHTTGMGIDEFWPRPQTPNSLPDKKTTSCNSSSTSSAPATVFNHKKIIKAGMNYFKLGEQLLVVCKKVS